MLYLKQLLIIRKRSIVMLLSIGCIASASASQTIYRDFWHPRYQKMRLAYCNLDQTLCGDALATEYCKRMGYAKMEVANIAYNVGLTHFIDSKAYCHGYPCDGFQLIRCSRSLSHHAIPPYYYRWRHFPVPRLNGYRVDWCYDGTDGCGKRAAYSFCRRMGYEAVKQYAEEKNIGATRALANQKICFGQQCQGFANIDCYR